MRGGTYLKKGDIVYLEKQDYQTASNKFNYEKLEASRWKVLRVSSSFKELIYTNNERTEKNPFPFNLKSKSDLDVTVTPHKRLRAWIRNGLMIKKNGFWLDTHRFKEHGILEIMWFGFSWGR